MRKWEGGVVEGGGGVQQKRILIGLELNAILSAHSGPPQYPEAKTKTVGMGCVCVCVWKFPPSTVQA